MKRLLIALAALASIAFVVPTAFAQGHPEGAMHAWRDFNGIHDAPYTDWSYISPDPVLRGVNPEDRAIEFVVENTDNDNDEAWVGHENLYLSGEAIQVDAGDTLRVRIDARVTEETLSAVAIGVRMPTWRYFLPQLQTTQMPLTAEWQTFELIHVFEELDRIDGLWPAVETAWNLEESSYKVQFDNILHAVNGSDWTLFENGGSPTGMEDEVPVSPPVERMSLAQNAPNPFNPSTLIRYELPAAGSVSLRIYDLAGNHIETLAEGPQAAGKHSARWNGTARGRAVPSGVYLYRLETEVEALTRRMTLVK